MRVVKCSKMDHDGQKRLVNNIVTLAVAKKMIKLYILIDLMEFKVASNDS